jgi:hypothetical protein
VKVPHDEGVATHINPEPCAVAREGNGEALAGEHTGQPLSRESIAILGADAVHGAEGNMDERASASARPTRRGPETLACMHAPCPGTGRSCARPLGKSPPVRIGEVRSRNR